ncbi:hypothetical protein KEM56_000321 [Ascosphaera pollenicola]|nr:hypothetical protein KEM56_000321 [Ascosphaera pollenicola]
MNVEASNDQPRTAHPDALPYRTRTTATTAATIPRPLALGEILDNIFKIMSEEAQLVSFIGRRIGAFELSEARSTKRGQLAFSNPRVSDLAACARVCKVWFDYAAPHLWGLAIPWLVRRDIETLLAPVTDVARRRFYASYIRQCSIKLSAPRSSVYEEDGGACSSSSAAGESEEGAIDDDDDDDDDNDDAEEDHGGARITPNPIFKGLAFPRLRRVLIDLDETASDHPEYAPAKLLCLASQPASTKEEQPRLHGREGAGAEPSVATMAQQQQEQQEQEEAIVITGALESDDDEEDDNGDADDCRIDALREEQRARAHIGVQRQRRLSMELTDADFAAEYTSDQEVKELGARNAKELIVRVRAVRGLDYGSRVFPSREAIEKVAEVIPVVFPKLKFLWMQRESNMSADAIYNLINRLEMLRYMGVAFEEHTSARMGN